MSNGQQTGAVIGGVVGGAIGFFAGGNVALGFSVGWTLGSLVGGAMDPPDDQITDMGRQEFPPLSIAVRGMTVPVAFGTNRIAAKPMWQGNNETVRQETNQKSGGKGGGSGGSKGPKQVNVTYTYKMDIAYALAMPHHPYSLVKGWIGADRISGNTISMIDANYPTDFEIYDPVEAVAGNIAVLNFDSASYFPGNIPETEDWEPVQSSIGVNMRWPGLAWLGFDGMNLGDRPVLPQLSFELSSGSEDAFNYTNDPALEWNATTGSAVSSTTFQHVDQYGNCWVVARQGGSYQCFDYETGAVLTSGSVSDWIATIGAAYPNAVTGISAPGLASVYLFHMSPDVDRVIMAFQGNVDAWCCAASFTIAEDGALTLVGALRFKVDGNVFGVPYTQNYGFLHTKRRQRSDPFLYYGSIDTGGNNTGFMTIPSVEDIEVANINGSMTGATLRLVNGEAFYYGIAGTVSPELFTLPYGTVTDLGVAWSTKIFWYTSAASANGSNTWLTAYLASNPNGGMITHDLNPLEDDYAPATGVTHSALSMPAPVEEGDIFIDGDGTPFTYFEDQGKNYDGTGSASFYYFGPPYIEQVDTYVWLVIFIARHKTDTSYVDSSSRVKTKLRAYFWNAIEQTFTEAKYIGGELFQFSEVGGSTSTILNWNDTAFYMDPDTNEVFLWLFMENGVPTADRLIKTRFGYLDRENDVDLTPPEIIKEALVSTRFGVYPGADIIDETTYVAAVSYCETNNIFVSIVYDRTEPVTRIIEDLLLVYGGYLIVDATAGKIKFGLLDKQTAPVRTIDNHHLIRKSENDAPVNTGKTAPQDTINLVRVVYLDRALDYQQNQVEDGDELDQDENGVRLREYTRPFVMTAATAQRMATRALWNNMYVRNIHDFHLGWKDADLEPGDLITLVDSFSNTNEVVRINQWKEVERGLFQVSATQQFDYIPGVPGTSVTSALWNIITYSDINSNYTNPTSTSGPTWTTTPTAAIDARAYELPARYYNGTGGKISVAWASQGQMGGATLFVSPDNVTYAAAAVKSPYPIWGRVLSGLGGDPMRPFRKNLEIALFPRSIQVINSATFWMNETLNDVSYSAMHLNTGLMWVGSEMLAYEGVTLIGQNRYRLDRVYRGWLGTRQQQHNSGALFYKHDNAVFEYDYSPAQIGTALYYKVVPFTLQGQEYEVASVNPNTYSIQGAAWAPPIPQPPRLFLPGSGDVRQTFGMDFPIPFAGVTDITLNWDYIAKLNGFGNGGYGANPGGFGAYAVTPPGEKSRWILSVTGSGGTIVRTVAIEATSNNVPFTNVVSYVYANSMNVADNGAWHNKPAFTLTAYNDYAIQPVTATTSFNLLP
jgi:hypothetical protein